jgi:hypothetical protein
VSQGLELPEESFKSWVGSPPQDLRGWAEAVMSAKLEAYSDSGDKGHFRIYAPEKAYARSPQGFRWLDKLTGLEGRYYGVRELPFGPRQPRVLEIKAGRVVRAGIPDFGSGDPRRLLYALDDRAGNPTEVETIRTSATLELTLKSEVPTAERRAFASLGVVATNSDKYYPRVWSFDVTHAPKILSQLEAVKIRIVEKKRGGRG